MSFLSVLKKIGGVALQVEHIAGPIVSLAVPGARPAFAILDGIVGHVQDSIVAQEAANPASGAGPQKLAAVQSDFQFALLDNLLAPILAARGESVTYDHAALDTAISAQVQAFNAFAVVKASIQIVKLPEPKAP